MTALAAVTKVRRRTGVARGAFVEGALAMLPLFLSVVPIGLVVGATAAESHLSPFAGWATSPTIYAGSAQLATIDLLDADAAVGVILLTVLVINARLLLYGASIAPHWRGTPAGWRALAAYLLVDPSFISAVDRYQRPATLEERQRFYLGGGAVLWTGWMLVTALGIAIGRAVPDSLGLDFVMPLSLVALVVPALRDRPSRTAAGVATVAAVAFVGLPFRSGLVVAGLAAVLVASRFATEDAR